MGLASLPKNEFIVPTAPNCLTSLRSRGLKRFKYPFLLPPSKVPFKDKIVMEHMLQSEQYLICMVIDPNDANSVAGLQV